MFLQYLKKNWLSIIACFVSLLLALFWLAMRMCWSGISGVLGPKNNPSEFSLMLPLYICIFLWVAFFYAVLGLVLFKSKKLHKIISLSISTIFVGILTVVLIMGGAYHMQFFMHEFWAWLAISLCIIALAVLLFFPVTAKTKKVTAIKCSILALVVLATALCMFDIGIFKITYEPVVYAVEEDYQIVFSTSSRAFAWVEVGDQAYYDLYAGSMRSDEIVHKIELPQEVLNNEKTYTIYAQKIVYSGPYAGHKGKIVSKSYNFRPVDTTDGLQYYSLSDVHSAVKGASLAGSHYANKMDFLIIGGDTVSIVVSHEAANIVNEVAFNITQGEFPVIYARGNHEVKGEYGEVYHKYVGCKKDDFYFTVQLADVFAIVLDIGENHTDEWWEFYGTAKFDVYRNEQTEFLKDIRDNWDLSAFNYKMAICHIPISYVAISKEQLELKKEWTNILNTINIDIAISGHQHTLYPLVPTPLIEPYKTLIWNTSYSGVAGKTDGMMTDANFPNFVVSRRSDGQLDATQEFKLDKFIGLYTVVDFNAKTQTSTYTNAKGEKVPVVHPFADIDYGTQIVTNLKN